VGGCGVLNALCLNADNLGGGASGAVAGGRKVEDVMATDGFDWG
jgi:hypothetical protein